MKDLQSSLDPISSSSNTQSSSTPPSTGTSQSANASQSPSSTLQSSLSQSSLSQSSLSQSSLSQSSPVKKSTVESSTMESSTVESSTSMSSTSEYSDSEYSDSRHLDSAYLDVGNLDAEHSAEYDNNSSRKNNPLRPQLINSSQHSFSWLCASTLMMGSLWGYIYILVAFIIFAALGKWSNTLTYLLGVWVSGLLVGACITIWYKWDKILKLSFAWRSFGFTASFYICLALCYFGFGLLNTTILVWVIFTILYLIISAIAITLSWLHEKRVRNNYQIQLKKYQTVRQHQTSSPDDTFDEIIDDAPQQDSSTSSNKTSNK